MAIDQRLIDEVTAATDIVGVIGSSIPLKRAGSNFKAPCPFHQEKTASFMVSPQKQIFHCFGCGEGGNVFSFLMKYENMSFPEAVRNLAGKANIHIPEERAVSKEKVSETKKMADIFRLATEYYRANFEDDSKGRFAREYIYKKRAFTPAVSEQFSVGYATQDWGGLFEFLQRNGFSPELIMKSGLVVKSSKGTVFDFFRNRVLFPIVNIRDKVIGFGGRTMGNDEPKYINTPETEYFRKRYELYGLNYARREVHANNDTIIVVEGYLDVIALHQAGIKNVVAPLGTALTQDHVRVLRRYADKVLMIFDGDKAGVNAALRSIDIFLAEEVHAEVVTLPQGCDPDSFVSEHGPEALKAAFEKAHDVFDFKLDYLMKTYDTESSFGLMKIAREMLTTAKTVKNAILLDRYIKKLATTLRIKESAIRDELNKKKGTDKDESSHDQKQSNETRRAKFEEELTLIHIMIAHPHYMKMVFDIVEPEDLQRKEAREIYLLLQRLNQDGNTKIALDTIMNHLQTDESKKVLSELAFLQIEEDTVEEALQNRLREVKTRSYDRKIAEVTRSISAAEANHDLDMLTQYQQRLIEYKREKQKL